VSEGELVEANPPRVSYGETQMEVSDIL